MDGGILKIGMGSQRDESLQTPALQTPAVLFTQMRIVVQSYVLIQ